MLVIGINGTTLHTAQRSWLAHPSVAGVILFTRNFASRTQVSDLVAQIRQAAQKPLLICVDQEGGPVQRFREGFTKLPPLLRFGQLYDKDPQTALALASAHAWLMASEIRALDIDLSFAPVVDLARGNRAIGERAFHADPQVTAKFTKAYLEGMHEAGMAATLKHFPGHGSVLEDTHFDHAIDPRDLTTLQATDLLPFVAGIQAGADAVMMAHVTYPAITPEPAGYSARWINQILRGDMGFRGVVFSDDIGMAAAQSVGGVKARIDVHLDAGCDAVLVCPPALVEDSLRAMDSRELSNPAALVSLLGRGSGGWDGLLAQTRYDAVKHQLATLEASA